MLLFCTVDEPIIFGLTFTKPRDQTDSVIGGSEVAVAVADLSEVNFDTEDGPVR